MTVKVNSFEMVEDEIKQINAWNLQHDKECPLIPKNWKLGDLPPYGCINGGREYRFTPTSIGTFISIKCACGAKFNVDSNL